MTASLRGLRARGKLELPALLGWAALAAATTTVIALPPGWLTIVLAALAVVALARDRRLGWIPASLLVTLALPYALAADTAPVTIGGWPVRPQDAAIAVGVIGSLVTFQRATAVRGWSRLRESERTLVVAVGVFAAIGLLALAVGIVGGHSMRDVLRDARWWIFYLAAPLALLAGVPASNLLRGLMLGATAFAAVVLATLLLPAFGDGLKTTALSFYSGTLRMQYGNSIFLVPAVAYASRRALVHRGVGPLLLLAVLFAALVLSLTRTTILVSAGMVIAIVAAHGLSTWRRRRWRIGWGAGLAPSAMAMASVILVVSVTTVGAIGLSSYASAAATETSSTPNSPPSDPLRRLIFSEEGSDIDAILGSGVSGGRLATYLSALNLIQPNPIVGRGLGQLVRVRWASNSDRAFTRGQQPGVDNAYLTIGMKAGGIGIAAFGALMLLPLMASLRRARRRAIWYLPAWLGILVLTLTQSFAVSSYGPFGLALLATLPFLSLARDSRLARSTPRQSHAS